MICITGSLLIFIFRFLNIIRNIWKVVCVLRFIIFLAFPSTACSTIFMFHIEIPFLYFDTVWLLPCFVDYKETLI